MPLLYTGDKTAGLNYAVDIPADGDLEDASSVQVSFEALLDAIATLSAGNPIFFGIPSFDNFAIFNGVVTHNAGVTFNHGATFTGATLVQITAPLTILTTTTVGGLFNIVSGAEEHVQSGGKIVVDSGGVINVQAGAHVNVNDGFIVGAAGTIQGSWTLPLASTLTIGGTLDIVGTVNLPSTTNLGGTSVAHGSTLNVHGTLDVKSDGALTVDAGAAVSIGEAFVATGAGRWTQRGAILTPTPGSGDATTTVSASDTDEVSVRHLGHTGEIHIYLDDNTGLSNDHDKILVTRLPNISGTQHETAINIYTGTGGGATLIMEMVGPNIAWAEFRFSSGAWVLRTEAFLP
jgi:hypothetical protein